MTEGYSKIDVHVHYLTDTYKTFLRKHYGEKPEGYPTPQWDLSKQKELMEKNQIAHALLGLSSPYFNANNQAETVATVEKNNDEIATLLATEPTMDFLAGLPLPYIEESLIEIERAYALGAKGFSVNTHSEDTYLGNPKLDPVMAELNRHHAIVAIHPTEATSVPKGVCEDLPIPAMEFFFDTTRTFVNMSLNEVFTHYPNIQWIFPHAGAFVPLLSDRIQVFFNMMHKPSDMFADMKHVYFDVAGMAEPKMLEVLLKVTTPDRLLYGSDFPHTSPVGVDRYRIKLENTDKLSEDEKAQIFYKNGAKLLGLE